VDIQMISVESVNSLVEKFHGYWDLLGPFQVLAVLVIPVIAWVIRKPVTAAIMRLFQSIAKGLGFTISEEVENSIAPAIRVIIVAFGLIIANDTLVVPEPYFSIIDKILVTLCVVAVFSAHYSLCIYIPKLFVTKHKPGTKKKDPPPESTALLIRVAQLAIIFLGLASALRVWGVDIGPALTGMGVAGAAVALAAQDYLKNLMGGFNNAAERRFSVGDLISVEGLVEGFVESVNLRSTVVRRLDTAPVHVPNSLLANAAIINHDRRKYRRIYWKVSLTYSSSVETLREICQRVELYINESDYFLPADKARLFVRIDSFNESSIDMLVYCFTRSRLYADFLNAKQDLALTIKSIVTEADADFAFPSRSIYIEASDSADPTHFVAANAED
jgi:MscS family membrane protein